MSRTDRLLTADFSTRIEIGCGHLNIRWVKERRVHKQLEGQREYTCSCSGPLEACSECP